MIEIMRNGRNKMIEVDYDEDGCVSSESSARLKSLFKTLFAQHGVPRTVEEIEDADFRAIAEKFLDEFGEAADEYEAAPSAMSGR